MTEKERFQRAFAPLHASPDTMTEVTKMTERKTKRPALRRAATIGLAAALVLALGSVAYASDLGGIQRTVQLWLNGEMTDATLTVNEGSYTLRYPDKDGTEREMGGGGVAFEPDGTERALTEEENAIVRRGRNTHAHHAAPRNQTAMDYQAATALEALVGYLYLTGQEARLLELFRKSQEVASCPAQP